MSTAVRIFTLTVCGLVLVVLAAGGHARGARQTLTGQWKASVQHDEPEKINLSFERRDEGGRNQMGSDFLYTDLQGLSRDQALRGGPVKFSLVREAGTISCEGSFQNGRGSGTFRFTANPGFVEAMRSRGFDFQRTNTPPHDATLEERLFAAATLNVTTALADDLRSAGFTQLDVEDLFKAAIFKVDSAFAREMKAAGFPDLGMEELVKARIFKVDAEFMREAAGMGFEGEPFENLVKLRIFKITPEFLKEARDEGLADLSIEDAVKLQIFKIDADFIRRAKADGVPLEVEELVQERIGVRRR